MPNDTSTMLTITGTNKNIKFFIDTVKNENSNLLFNNLFPIPEYQKNNWIWYSINWGVKCDTYNVGNWVIADNIASIKYYTAWCPATDFFLKISEDFPDLKFTNVFADGGGGFVGCTKISNGMLIEKSEYHWLSKKGIMIRKIVGYFYEDENS